VSETAILIPPEWRAQIPRSRVIGGRLCGVQRFIFTTGLLVGLRFDALFYDYDARYCYETAPEAVHALLTWDGRGDPPGHWVKEKVSGRLGPGMMR